MVGVPFRPCTILVVDDSPMIADLVVDDSPMIADLVVDLLGDEPQYHPVALADPQTALARLPELRPDLFVFDVGLPDMDGVELYHRAQAVPAGQGVPVLFITASLPTFQRVHAQGFAVLIKPLDLDDLLHQVARLLHTT